MIYKDFEDLFQATVNEEMTHGKTAGKTIEEILDREDFFRDERNLSLVEYDDDDSWMLFLEHMSFNEADAMDTPDLKEFREDPMNRILLLSIFGKKIGAIALTYHSAESVYMESFAILPKFRGLGLGEEFLDRLLNELHSENVKTLTAHVRASNPARTTYKKALFKEYGQEEGVYDDGEMAIQIRYCFEKDTPRQIKALCAADPNRAQQL